MGVLVDGCAICNGRGEIATGQACPACDGTGVTTAEQAAAHRQMLVDAAVQAATERFRQAGTNAAEGVLRGLAQAREDAKETTARAGEVLSALLEVRRTALEIQAASLEIRSHPSAALFVDPSAPDPTDPPPGITLPAGMGGEIYYLDSLLVRQLDVWGPFNAPNAPGILANPMTTLGDTIFGLALGVPQRLAIGTAGQVLTVSGGVPVWANSAAGFADPTTTAGDLIFKNAVPATTRLAIGVAGQVLTVVGGLPAWANAPSGFANPMTTKGDLILADTGGTALRLPLGAAGQVLTVAGGTAVWQTNPAGFANPMTAKGDLILATTGGAATRLPVGAAGQVLGVSGGTAAWVAAPVLLQPSGDTTGATDGPAIAAAIAATGQVQLAPGTFYVGTSGSAATALYIGKDSNLTTQGYGLTLRGSGAGQTIISVINNGIGIYAHGSNAPYPSNVPAATIADLTIDGTNAGANAVGLDFGDGSDYYINRVRVSNFTGASAIGIRESNNAAWTEKADVNVQCYNNTTQYVMTVNGGVQSHMYSWHRIHMNVQPGQNGFVMKNGAFIRNGQLLDLYGNTYPDNSGLSGVWLDVSGNDGLGNFCFISQTQLHIKCENTPTGTPTAFWTAIKLGGTVDSSHNRMLNCHGGITFTGGQWKFDTVWAAAGPGTNGLGTGAFTFWGMINEPANYNGTAPNKALSLFNANPTGVPAQQAPVNAQPSNPAATASATLVMMGLGGAGTQPTLYTPKSSGIVQIQVTGVGWTNTAAVQFAVGCRFGTGTPPVNGAAVVGTRFGAPGDPNKQAATTTDRDQFAFVDTLTLTPGTQYWFDLAVSTSVPADTAQVSNISMNFEETS